jgi:hypothetical protein
MEIGNGIPAGQQPVMRHQIMTRFGAAKTRGMLHWHGVANYESLT